MWRLLDRKSSRECTVVFPYPGGDYQADLCCCRRCDSCIGVDYRSMGDRAAEATRMLAGWCLCVTVGAVCVTELFMLWSAVSLSEALKMVGYVCSTGDGSGIISLGAEGSIELNDSYGDLLWYDRMLWMLLGAKYSMSIVACCLPLAIEWGAGRGAEEALVHGGSVHGAGGYNYAARARSDEP